MLTNGKKDDNNNDRNDDGLVAYHAMMIMT